MDCTLTFMLIRFFLVGSCEHLSPTTWMGLGVYFPEFFNGVVCVHLRGGKSCMAQDLLDRIEVGTVFEHVGGEGVAQHVWAPFFLRGDSTKVMCNEPLYASPCHRLSFFVHQQRGRWL